MTSVIPKSSDALAWSRPGDERAVYFGRDWAGVGGWVRCVTPLSVIAACFWRRASWSVVRVGWGLGEVCVTLLSRWVGVR